MTRDEMIMKAKVLEQIADLMETVENRQRWCCDESTGEVYEHSALEFEAWREIWHFLSTYK